MHKISNSVIERNTHKPLNMRYFEYFVTWKKSIFRNFMFVQLIFCKYAKKQNKP